MNRSRNPASSRPSLTRLAVFGLLAGTALLSVTVRADDPPSSPRSPILTLNDGGFVAGTLSDSDQPGLVRWTSPAFVSPLEFPIGTVESIRFPSADKLPKSLGQFGFELTGGDLLFGSIVSLDEKFAELDITRLGKIKLERTRLRRIFRQTIIPRRSRC